MKANNDDSETEGSLSEIYENGLSESYKNKEGVFYTPPGVVEKFFEYLPDDCSDLVFCDPCCGSGNFLIKALEHGFRPSNVYGFDIDETALAIARKRVSTIEGGSAAVIEEKDFLSFASRKDDEIFDVVFTNPPWGKKIPKTTRDDLAEIFGAGSSKDTSALFFFASLRLLKKSGYLGFLLQDAFFNIATFKDARLAALNNRILGLNDFGRVFDGLMTKAKGIVLRREKPDNESMILCAGDGAKRSIRQDAFQRNPKAIFNFACSADDLAVIEHVLSIEHRTLHNSARWGLGIVTGNNKRYCSSENRDGFVPVFKGSDISRDGLKPASSFIPADFSLYQQVAPLSLYKASEKLIYRFISSDLVFYHDTQQRFILNSANMLILCDDFPISHKQLCDILNSKFMSWLFKRIFDTHKVLRTDIESLPIFTSYFDGREDFSEDSFLDFLSIEEVPSGAYRIKSSHM